MLAISQTHAPRHVPKAQASRRRIGMGMDRKQVIGRALYRLRKKADLTQGQSSEAAGVTQVTWGRYEKGDRDALLKEDLQEKLAAALGFSRQDLLAEALAVEQGIPMFDAPRSTAKSLSPSVSAPSSEHLDLNSLIDLNTRTMQVVTEDVSPYAEPGTTIVYNLRTMPKRHQGVVIKMRGGPYLVRIYTRTSSSHIECVRFEGRTIDGQTSYAEIPEFIPLHESEGVYPITLRLG